MIGVDKKMFEQAIDQLIKNFDDLSFGQDNYYEDAYDFEYDY